MSDLARGWAFEKAVAAALGILAEQTASVTIELSGAEPPRVTIVQWLTAEQEAELTRVFELSSWQERTPEPAAEPVADAAKEQIA